MSDSALRYPAWTLPAALAATFAALWVVRPVSGPAVTLVVGSLAAAAISALLMWRGGGVGRATLIPIAFAAAAVAALGVSTAIASVNPGVSALGMWGTRSAWAMWLLALIFLGASSVMAAAGPTHAAGVARTIAAVAALAALSALAEAAGLLTSGSGWSDKPAGVFENALSLAQFLIVGAACALAWYASAAGSRWRPLALVCAALCLLGIALTASRGAYAGLVVGALAFVAVWHGAGRWRRVARWSLAAGLAGGAALIAAAGWAIEHPFVARLDELTTGRLTLYHAMLAGWPDVLLGSGPLQRSAYTTWGVDEALQSSGQVAFDPHSIVLYWLIGGGILGFAVACAALWRLARAVTEVAETSTTTALLAAGCAGWFAATLSTWVNPFALMCVAVLVGAVSVRPREDSPDDVPVRAVGAPALVACLGLALALGVSTAHELRWTAAMDADALTRFELASELYERSGDPSYAVRAMVTYFEMREGDVDRALLVRALGVAESADDAVEWHVSTAYNVIYLQADAVAFGRGTVEEFERTVTRARRSDPASGFFDFIAAERALALGLPELAERYAARSLAFPQSPQTRELLEGVLEGEPASTP